MLSGWGGVRDGSKPPPMCPQLNFTVIVTGRGGENAVQGDEDCLYLNIFTPKVRTQ